MTSSSSIPEDPLAGRYAIEARIGAGAMSNVMRAHDLETNTKVAIKLLDSDDPGESARARFRHEAETLAELRHPSIVTYLGHGFTASGRPYLVMEWVVGEDLRTRLQRGPLAVDELLTLLRGVTAGLGVAHRRGIIHRDLKPSNIVLRHQQVDQAVLIDFGVARDMRSSAHITKTGALIGTPAYMAPEQARGERALPHSSDIFSLGCVAFHCLIGRSPFAAEQIASVLTRILFEDAPSVCALRPELPRAIGELIARMLAREPSGRPADADALHRELLNLTFSDSTDGGRTMLDDSFTSRDVVERQLCCILVGAVRHATPTETLDEPEPPGDDDPRRVIQTMGGRAERLLDGTLVAAFHSQTSASDRAMLAARCALELRARWPELGFALATGRGHVREDRTIGEVVDRAHSLLAHAPAEAILLDELSADLLDGGFELGDSSSEAAALLVRERPRDRKPRRLLGKPIPCLGRAHELGLLELTLRSCVEEREAHFVLVNGEPGSGKSRVRHELLERAGADPELTILRGDGDPMTVGSPYAILGDAIRRAAGIERGTHDPGQREAIAALVRRWSIDDASVDFLAEIAGVRPPAEPGPARRAALDDPNLMREHCSQAWLMLVHGALASGPVLVVAEDLHWGDRLTLELLLHTQTALADAPLMVVGFARPELFETHAGLTREFDRGRHRQHIRLAALGRSACERLIRRALDGVLEPSATLVERLIEHASGNPLHLEELIRTVASGGVDDFPSTVGAMLQARMEQLDSLARRALLAASVLGPRFALADLVALLEQIDRPSLQLATERLIDVEMLEPDSPASPDPRHMPGKLRFRHALLRDAAYQLLSIEGARELHRLTAEHLITRQRGDLMTIAEHLAAAGLDERAASYYLRAAEQAATANAVDETLRRADKGLACVASGPVASCLSAVKAWSLSWRGDWTTLVPLAEATLPQLVPGEIWWCRCIATLIGVGFLTGDEAMLSRTTEALLEAEIDVAALAPYLDALNVGIGSATMIGRNHLAARYHARMRELTRDREPSDELLRLIAFADASLRFYVDLDLDAALADAEATIARAQMVGDRRYMLFGQVMVGLCEARLGRPERAIATIRAALTDVEAIANPYLTTYASIELAGHLVDDPRPEAIELGIELAARLIAVPTIPAPYPGWARVVRARGRLARAELDAAQTDLHEALELLADAPRLLVRARLGVAALELARGSSEQARATAEAALDASSRERGWEQLDALLTCARLHARAGDHQAARAAAEQLASLRATVLEHVAGAEARERVEAALSP